MHRQGHRFMPQIAVASLRTARPATLTRSAVEPFRDVEQAWFWTMAALNARHSGTRSSGGTVKRPCDPDDIVKCLDQLYRNRRIDLGHARVLRIWGERQMAPDTSRAREHLDAVLWNEAMERLAWPLRMKGIVV
jgi:hypothetical protein